MTYAVTCFSSTSPHSSHTHFSMRTPRLAKGISGWGSDDFLRNPGAPQAGHGRPGIFLGADSSADRRRSISSMRAGASLIRFHSPQRSSAASMSWSKLNVSS
jgi:hypothetical protein